MLNLFCRFLRNNTKRPTLCKYIKTRTFWTNPASATDKSEDNIWGKLMKINGLGKIFHWHLWVDCLKVHLSVKVILLLGSRQISSKDALNLFAELQMTWDNRIHLRWLQKWNFILWWERSTNRMYCWSALWVHWWLRSHGMVYKAGHSSWISMYWLDTQHKLFYQDSLWNQHHRLDHQI